MGILTCDEMWPASASYGENAERRYTRKFLVITDSSLVGAVEVLTDANLPVRWSYYTDPGGGAVDLGAILQSYDLSQNQDDPTVWEVSCEYSAITSDPRKGDPAQQDQNPTKRPPRISWSFQKVRVPFERDVNGKAVRNSARDPYDPPNERNDVRVVLRVVRFERSFSVDLARQYTDAVNSDVFFGQPAHSAKIESISAESHYENGISSWEVSYEIHFRRGGWYRWLLDQGMQTLNITEGTRAAVRDRFGNPLSQPVCLDGLGGEAAYNLVRVLGAHAADETRVVFSGLEYLPEPGEDTFVYLATRDQDPEVMRLTAVEADTIVVQRGALGSTARALVNQEYLAVDQVYYRYQEFEALPFKKLKLIS